MALSWLATRYARQIVRNPSRETVFTDLAGSHAENDRGCCFRRYVEINAVEAKEHDDRCKRRSLIAVDKGVIPRNAERICGCERRETGFAVREFVERPSQR